MNTWDLAISTTTYELIVQMATEQSLTIEQLIGRLLEVDHGDSDWERNHLRVVFAI